MTVLCFIEPAAAISVIGDSLGRSARRRLVREVVAAWVDEIPEHELASHYAKTVAALGDEDLALLAGWHASQHGGQPVANAAFLLGIFPSLGESRREALRVAAGFRGEEAFDAGVAEEHALAVVLPHLSRERARELAQAALDLYVRDRLGTAN